MILLPPLKSMPDERIERMRSAAVDVVEMAEALVARDTNAVSEVVAGHEFEEWQHFPAGDVLDKKTGAQFYYHSHNGAADEHGHFHTFLRKQGIPEGLSPVSHGGTNAREWPEGDDLITHLVAISMDHHGLPTHLFTTNRWVTGDTVFSAEDAISLLDGFHVGPEPGQWPETNLWITGMMALFNPQIEGLIRERDDAIAGRKLQIKDDDKDVYEDRGVEITSICEISIMDQLEWLEMLE